MRSAVDEPYRMYTDKVLRRSLGAIEAVNHFGSKCTRVLASLGGIGKQATVNKMESYGKDVTIGGRSDSGKAQAHPKLCEPSKEA